MAKKTDEIIEEIRRHRMEHAASLEYDMKRIVEDLQRLERESGREVVTRTPRKPLPVRGPSSV
jgi:hypothetical protein